MSILHYSARIPTVEEEQPVIVFHGHQLSSPAYHARHDDLWPPKAGQQPPKAEWRKAIDLYLANFCRPVKTIANHVKCIACDAVLTRAQLAYSSRIIRIDTTSEYLEAKCSGCGYPIRCRHKMTLPAPNDHVVIVALDFFPLCYHPLATEAGAGKGVN